MKGKMKMGQPRYLSKVGVLTDLLTRASFGQLLYLQKFGEDTDLGDRYDIVKQVFVAWLQL